MRLIPYYHKNNQIDSLNHIIEHAENTCGISEPLLRIKILLAIEQNYFSEAIYDKIPITDYWKNYNTRMRSNSYYYYNHNQKIITGYDYLMSFDSFTLNLAQNVLQNKSNQITELEMFFVRLYAEKEFFKSYDEIRYGEFTESKLKEDFFEDLGSSKDQRINMALFTGLWIPMGNKSILGNHPKLGFIMGLGSKKLSLDVVMNMRYFNSPNYFQIEKFDSIYTTNSFLGGLFAIQLNGQLFHSQKTQILLSAGVGFEGFSSEEIQDPKDPDETIGLGINSTNMNFGLIFRRYINYITYWGIECRYNIVDYENVNGSDLSGNSMSIRLVYGFNF